tara:strand:- start:4048 stop:4236 length:189 start_codon:yes stop_codon:yes gene_type:complete
MSEELRLVGAGLTAVVVLFIMLFIHTGLRDTWGFAFKIFIEVLSIVLVIALWVWVCFWAWGL